jgi:hypothetical protein
MSAPHHLLLPLLFQRQRSAAIPMLFDCCLLLPMMIVLASLRLILRHDPIYAETSANTSMGTVQFQYWASSGAHTGIGTAAMEFISSMDTLPSARTSIGTAAMEFISSTGTCQVPIPVLALQRWSSFPVRALAKCLYQYWHCRDGVHFQYKQ